jgi:hypothetical protein
MAEVWIGSGCDVYATRSDTSSRACERVATVDIAALTASSDGVVHVPLPSRAVFSPVKHDCHAGVPATSSAYLIVYADPANPLAMCTLPLSPHLDPPAVPAQIAALTRAGDGSVEVGIAPPETAEPIVGYQLLCATRGDEPFARGDAPMYSLCPGQHIERRGITPAAPSGTLATFDPAYACSDMIAPSATRVDLPWLGSGVGANFTLLTVDAYGNFSASATRSIGAAPATQPMLPAHGCSVATTGEGSSLELLAMLTVFTWLWRRNLTL